MRQNDQQQHHPTYTDCTPPTPTTLFPSSEHLRSLSFSFGFLPIRKQSTETAEPVESVKSVEKPIQRNTNSINLDLRSLSFLGPPPSSPHAQIRCSTKVSLPWRGTFVVSPYPGEYSIIVHQPRAGHYQKKHRGRLMRNKERNKRRLRTWNIVLPYTLGSEIERMNPSPSYLRRRRSKKSIRLPSLFVSPHSWLLRLQIGRGAEHYDVQVTSDFCFDGGAWTDDERRCSLAIG